MSFLNATGAALRDLWPAGWDAPAVGAVVAGFLAVVLLLEGVVLWWLHTRSAAARRWQQRLHAWLPPLADPAAAGPAAPGAGRPPDGAWARLSDTLRRRWEALAPRLGLQTRQQQRVSRQLPEALDLMARSLRAGHALPAALQLVAEETPRPLGPAFGRTQEQLAYGRPLEAALQDLADRLPGDDMRFFVTALRVQRQTGGNLAEVLDRLSTLMRQRLALADRQRVLLAEGRLSAQILTALPLLTAAVLHAIRPDFMRVLWTDPVGLTLLQATLGLYAVGLVWMWRLTRLDA